MRLFLGIMMIIWLTISSGASTSSLGEVAPKKRGHEMKPPDFFKLAVQYPLSVCEKVECGHTTRANLPTYFTIHGLWEGMNDKTKEAPITSKEKFDLQKLEGVRGLRGKLDTFWFDAKNFDRPAAYAKFWKHEWDAHGRRSGYYMIDYFETTLGKEAYDHFRVEYEGLVRRSSKYVPGRVFKLSEFVNSFGSTGLAVPWARCHELGNKTWLVVELVFRIDPSTGSFVPHVGADDNANCPLADPTAVGLLPSRAPIPK